MIELEPISPRVKKPIFTYEGTAIDFLNQDLELTGFLSAFNLKIDFLAKLELIHKESEKIIKLLNEYNISANSEKYRLAKLAFAAKLVISSSPIKNYYNRLVEIRFHPKIVDLACQGTHCAKLQKQYDFNPNVPLETRILDFEVQAKKNRKKLKLLIDNAFERHAKVLIVRVDLGYKGGIDAFYDSRFKLDFKRFNNGLRAIQPFLNPKKHLGYGWCAEIGKSYRDYKPTEEEIIESPLGVEFIRIDGKIHGNQDLRKKRIDYLRTKGIHYHMLFLFNGDALQNGHALGKKIGEHWLKITNNNGSYWNVSDYKNELQYKNKGLGAIGTFTREEYSQPNTQRNINRVVAYLTKQPLFKIKQPNFRGFGTSEFKNKTKDKRGRKPKGGNSIL